MDPAVPPDLAKEIKEMKKRLARLERLLVAAEMRNQPAPEGSP